MPFLFCVDVRHFSYFARMLSFLFCKIRIQWQWRFNHLSILSVIHHSFLSQLLRVSIVIGRELNSRDVTGSSIILLDLKTEISKNFFIPPRLNISGTSCPVEALIMRLSSLYRIIPFWNASESSGHCRLIWSILSHQMHRETRFAGSLKGVVSV